MMKTIRTYINVAEAGFAASLLEAAGIQTLLNGEESFLMTPGLATGGIRLQVEEAEAERALRLLEEGFDADQEAPPQSVGRAGVGVEKSPGAARIPVPVFVAGLTVLILLWFVIQQGRENDARNSAPAEETWSADYNHDGQDDHFYTSRNGFFVHGEVDRNYDGRIDSWTRCDSEGREESYDLDENFDGVVDSWSVFQAGDLQSSKRDTDYDGKPDYFGTFRHGQAVTAEYRPGDSKVVTRRQFFTNNFITEEHVDEDLDGQMDYRILFDAFGVPSKNLPLSDPK